MKYCMITFRSVTPAQRAENEIKGMGLFCALQRTTRRMEEQGCGYSLRLRAQDTPRAVAWLRLREIPFRKVYILEENGKMEEWQL